MRNTNSLIVYAAVMLAVLSVLNLVLASGIKVSLDRKIAEAEEAGRPAELLITKITFPDCSECYDIDNAADYVKSLDAEIKSERTVEFPSDEADSLIKRYGISILPAMIIEGETGKDNVASGLGKIGHSASGAVVFDTQRLPYYDIKAGRVLGIVNVTIITDSSCAECVDMKAVVNAFRQGGITFAEEKVLEYRDPDAASLISSLNINRIPVILLSDSILDYTQARQLLQQLNASERKGLFVIPPVQPPYRNLSSGETVGIVRMVSLVDGTCRDCYNVSVHEGVLARFGIFIGNKESYDIASAEGKNLVEKYNITKVPTILLSPDIGYYETFAPVWEQVGTTEPDGWRVFRNINALGNDIIYKNLS